jgi:polyhydroxyalkanoate synthesis regulator phasin
MTKQAAGETMMQELPDLLREILDDLEGALNIARNPPAKKLLRARIERLRRAIEAMAVPETALRTTDSRREGRLLVG